MPINIPQLKDDDGKFPKTPYAGLYILSSKPYLLRGTTLKIGKSVNLRRRLNSYNLCYPHGFYIHALIIEKPTTKEERHTRTSTLEKSMFNVIKDLHPSARLKNLLSGAREAFTGLTAADMKRIVARMIDLHPRIIDAERSKVERVASGEGTYIAHVKPSDYTMSKEDRFDLNIAKKETKAIDRAVKREAKRKPKAASKRVSARKVKSSTLYNQLKALEYEKL